MGEKGYKLGQVGWITPARCPNGHLLEGDNFKEPPSGGRRCKLCDKIRKIEERKAKAKAKGKRYIPHSQTLQEIERLSEMLKA